MEETQDRMEKPETKISFERREKTIRKQYGAMVGLNLLLNALYQVATYTYFLTNLLNNIFNIMITVIPFITLTISYIRLRKYFQLYHEKKFKTQKKSFQIYFAFDFVFYSSWILNDVITILFPLWTPNQYFGTILVIYFPVIQAFGICFYKASLDPLSNISSLNYLRIVSINQIPTDSFWPCMITENTFAKQEHKKQVADAYMSKKSNASSLISTYSE